MSEENAAEMVNVAKGEYDELMNLKAELRKRRIEDRVKGLGSNKVTYRQRMVMRRVDQKKLVPDEDLVAYDAIHKLMNPAGDSKQKITITENQIKAYKVIDPDFNKVISLAEVLDKVEELKAAGTLSKVGDNAEDDEAGDVHDDIV